MPSSAASSNDMLSSNLNASCKSGLNPPASNELDEGRKSKNRTAASRHRTASKIRARGTKLRLDALDRQNKPLKDVIRETRLELEAIKGKFAELASRQRKGLV